MIEWLSEGYGVSINAVVLKYIRTRAGSEVLTRSAIISEQVEAERTKKAKKFTIPMSDDPGEYEKEELREMLLRYLSTDGYVTVDRIRDVLLPACLTQDVVTRDFLKEELVRTGSTEDLSKAGLSLTGLSSQLGMQKNDFLRQVIGYGYPNNPWEKDNYFVREEYRELVRDLLAEVRTARESEEPNSRLTRQ